MERVLFPETADEPPRFLLWRIDDVAVPLLFLCFGMLLGNVVIFVIAGLAMMAGYQKYRDGRPEFYVLHAMYWFGIYPARGPGFINPYIRTLLP
ncbi:Type IV conjugative transfer system protein TraL (plasmid) [Rhodovastum atsumiense]|uniref:Type IV conjugative transfer system protein TraL n=1 Tax=Rhodovastum atsumiense TaxID=504468 RepID=A0A5M6IJS7_9PROT|nr:type IV conjugative transfer system protein TraL [Rhodovastum atsumiense]KAA5608524.1 type IV conjugative transfer system protein TraL [Rhodovastum atsumiense]CAH2605802.1 Type IV conjugative transfer system protein TraL [Rhodovastum atsumiense]